MRKKNKDILKNTIIYKLQELSMSMLEPMAFDNQHVSVSNIYVTGNLTFSVILLSKKNASPKQCFKYKLHPKLWLDHRYKIGKDWTVKALRLISECDLTSSARLAVKESSIWECVEHDEFSCPIFIIRLIWVTTSCKIYLIMEMNI